MVNTRLILLVLILVYFSSANAEDGLEARKKHHIKHGLFYANVCFVRETCLGELIKLLNSSKSWNFSFLSISGNGPFDLFSLRFGFDWLLFIISLQITVFLVVGLIKNFIGVDFDLLYKYNGTALMQYLTFLAIKVKLVLVIGVIFTVIVFGGKLFALIKYAGFKDSYHHPKEVYIHSPHDGEYIQDHPDFLGPHEIEHPFKRFSTINTFNTNKRKNDNLAGYKRSSTNINYFEKIMSFLMRLNLTERIFKEMKMDQLECRKKFVCETKFIAQNSSLFRAVLRLMSDSTFESYKPNNKTNSIEQCRTMYPSCEVR